MRGKLTRIKAADGNPALRTTSIEGDFLHEPTPGNRFAIFGEPLTEGATFRMVSTSPVQEVRITQSGFSFVTESASVYELEVLP